MLSSVASEPLAGQGLTALPTFSVEEYRLPTLPNTPDPRTFVGSAQPVGLLQEDGDTPGFGRMFGGALIGSSVGFAVGAVGGVLLGFAVDAGGEGYTALFLGMAGGVVGSVTGTAIAMKDRAPEGTLSGTRSLGSSLIGSALGFGVAGWIDSRGGDGWVLVGVPVVQSIMSAWIASGG